MGDQGSMNEKTFWVAHTRGPNFDVLQRRGFVTFFPAMDDYVFLPNVPENKPLLRKQTELGVMFLTNNGKHVEITEEELQQMSKETVDQLNPQAEITVLMGTYENLDGVITQTLDGNQIQCILNGFNRTYEAVLKKTDVVLKQKLGEILVPIDDPILMEA